MKIAYLIVTNKNPKLLKKMIASLSSDECEFIIHLDKKCDINEFSSIKGRNILFVKNRIPVYWGEWSIVQAILILIQKAFEVASDCDYFILLSGSDYPLRSKEYIHRFFEENRGMEFISTVNLREAYSSHGCARYIAGRRLAHLNTLRIPSDKPVARIIVKTLAQVGLARRDHRKHLRPLEAYTGNTWWTLTRGACRYILDFVHDNQSTCNYLKNTFAADEILFHTILGNSVFNNRIRRNVMYEDWSIDEQEAGSSPVRHKFLQRSAHKGGHPALLGEKHLEVFEKNERVIVDDFYGSGEMLFARKFSDDKWDMVQRIGNIVKRREKKVINA